MKFINYLYKHIFNGTQLKNLNKLKKIGILEKDNIMKYQFEKLRKTLQQSKSHVPYYADKIRFDIANFDYADFCTIPLMDKSILADHIESLQVPNYHDQNEVFKNTSGGSTGRSSEFFQTKYQNKIGQSNYLFALTLNQVDIYQKSIDLWGAERDMYAGGVSQNLKLKLQNKLLLNTYVLNHDIIKNYINIINEYKPHFIKSYVHSIYEIAKYIIKNDIKINCNPIIHTSTGPLYPEIKSVISRAFNNTYVYSFYGSRELAAIATNIPNHIGMFTLYDNVFLEIINENGNPVTKGESGEIVLTTLNNDYMPLVRYKIGDRATKLDDNPFGCLHISDVLGRTLGVLQRKDGTSIDGQYFVALFFNVKGIDNFQIVQESIEKIIINIVKGREFEEESLLNIKEKIKQNLPDIQEICIQYLSQIELTSTGKIMYVLSKI